MIEIQPQLQALGAGLGPVHGRHVLAQIHQIGGLGRERQLPVLVATEIEHVVEQAQQLVPRLADVGQCRALLGIEGGVAEPLQQPQNGVHGGTNFVAHRREETPLGQHRLLGPLMGGLQRLLLLDPGCDILHHPVHPPP